VIGPSCDWIILVVKEDGVMKTKLLEIDLHPSAIEPLQISVDQVATKVMCKNLQPGNAISTRQAPSQLVVVAGRL
jgi:hypothetical protein